MPNSVAKNSLSNVWGRLNNVPIVRGKGSYVFDKEGNRFLDFTSGIGVTVTGHCHDKIVAAVQSQATQLLFGQMNCMLPEVTIRYSNALREVTPDSIDTFFFSNSGAEAVEGAVKLAKAATGRTNIIAFEGGFHGRTAMTMALTSSKSVYRAGYQPLPAGVFFAPFPNTLHYGWESGQTTKFCLAQLARLLQTQSSPDETAAIIIEPILGEGGFVPAPQEFLIGLRKLCDETGILLIMDEIQSGFGRTGTMWAHEKCGIMPDIMTMAKGIASGLPMSAIGASSELMSKWTPGSHGGTYGGGSAIAMAAALATLEVIEEESLIQNAANMGDYLTEGIASILSAQPFSVDIRGQGLMIGIEFVSSKQCGESKQFDAGKCKGETVSRLVGKIQKECLHRGLMLLTCGTGGNVIRWMPPLNVTKQEADSALEIFAEAVKAAT